MDIRDNFYEKRTAFDRLLHNATLMGTHKSKKFLGKLFDERKLHIRGLSRDMVEKGKADFFLLLDIFEEKYKEQADLGFYRESGLLYPCFKVIYPEFVITNSKGRRHTIKDLIVLHSFNFSNGCIHPSQLEGGRLSKTNLEILSGYQQSHLGSFSIWPTEPLYISKFCVGSATDVSLMLAEFEVEMDFDRYELFLFCVDSMITWESLEGVPYIKMETIANAGSKRITNSTRYLEDTIVTKILERKLPLKLDFYVDEGRYKIYPNLKANDFIKEVVSNTLTFADLKKVLVTRTPNTFDNFLELKAEGAVQIRSTKITSTDHYTLFRGKKVYPKVIKEDRRQQSATSVDDTVVYPKFLENVLRKLEKRIYEQTVTKSTVELINTRNNAFRGTTSDTVSM